MATKTIRFVNEFGNEVKRLIVPLLNTKKFGPCSYCSRPYKKGKKYPREVCPACKKAGVKLLKRGTRKHVL